MSTNEIEPNGGIPKAKDGRWKQLAIVSSAISSRDQVVWTLFGHFWVVNVLLLVALFQDGKFPTNPWVTLIITLAGFALSLVWGFIQDRTIERLKVREELFAKIEREMNLPESIALSGKMNSDSFQAQVVHLRVSVRPVVLGLIAFVGILWLLETVASIQSCRPALARCRVAVA